MSSIRKKSALCNNRSGFTLPEVLVTILLLTAVSALTLSLMLSGSRSWQLNKTQILLQGELRKAGEWIKEDMRQSGSSGITNVPANGTWYTTITFQKVTGASGGATTWSAQNYIYALGGTNNTDLRRTDNGVARAIAYYITVLQFRRQAATANIMEVNLTAQTKTEQGRTITMTSSFQINLRN